MVATTKAALADVLSTSTKTVGQWSKEPGFPGGPSGPWQLKLILLWLRERNSAFAAQVEELSPDLIKREREAKLAKVEHDAEWKRLKNEQMRGDLVSRDEVIRHAKQEFTTIKNRLEACPENVALDRVPREWQIECEDGMRTEVHRALTELADGWRDNPIPGEDD